MELVKFLFFFTFIVNPYKFYYRLNFDVLFFITSSCHFTLLLQHTHPITTKPLFSILPISYSIILSHSIRPITPCTHLPNTQSISPTSSCSRPLFISLTSQFSCCPHFTNSHTRTPNFTTQHNICLNNTKHN